MAAGPDFFFKDFMTEKKCRIEDDDDMDLMDPNHGLFSPQEFFSPLNYESPMPAMQQAQLLNGSPSLLSLQRLHPSGATMNITSSEEYELDSNGQDDPDNFDASFGGLGRQVTEYQWPDQTWPKSWGPQPPKFSDTYNNERSAVAKTMVPPGQMIHGNMIALQLAQLTANSQQDERNPLESSGIQQNKFQNSQQLSSGHSCAQMPCMGDPGLAAAAIEAAQRPRGSSQRSAVGTIPPAEWQNATTVMLRNIPNKYNRSLLMEELGSAGFADTYDFLYLPIDPETFANRGYAFVNFYEPHIAWEVRLMYEGQKMGKFNSDKVVSLVPAALQGYEANYAHYSSARVNRGPAETRPLFLREPSCMPGSGAQRRRGGRRSQGSLIDQAMRGKSRVHKETTNPTDASANKALYYFGVQGGSPTSPGEVARKAKADHADHRVQPQQLQSTRSSARFCQDCGGQAQTQFRFCQFCGAKLLFSS